MRFALVLAIALTACCAGNQPLVTPAQVDSVKAAYQAAADIESRYDTLPQCLVPYGVACYDDTIAERIRVANFNAAAALVQLDQERTAGAMAKAREKVATFTAVANGQ